MEGVANERRHGNSDSKYSEKQGAVASGVVPQYGNQSSGQVHEPRRGCLGMAGQNCLWGGNSLCNSILACRLKFSVCVTTTHG